MMVHVADAVARGHKKIMIHSVDTDVVVLARAAVQKLSNIEGLYKFIISKVSVLGPDKAVVLPLFHAFTGCDTVSFFNGRGKKSAFEAWKAFPMTTDGFMMAMEGCIDEAMPIIHKFVKTMYDRTSSSTTLNVCSFYKKDPELENIPPTEEALHQHLLSEGCLPRCPRLGQSLEYQQKLPSPSEWGWKKDDNYWEPLWTNLPVAAKACMELVRCKCKKNVYQGATA